MLLSGAAGALIGGTAAGDRNIISGNTGVGIGLFGGTTGAAIEGNLIGTDITGSTPLGNGTGVQIDGGSSNNTIGGTGALAGNTIAYSAGIGVDVDSTAGTGNVIRLNAIFSNAGLGIDLGGDGVTLNDSVAHSGPNNHQNFPVLSTVSSSLGTTTVTGTSRQHAEPRFTLDFYTLSSINASGYGEGRYRPRHRSGHDRRAWVTRASRLPFPTPASGAQFVTATATDPSGNTSEFSTSLRQRPPADGRDRLHQLTVNEGVAIPFDGRRSTDPDGDPLTYSWSFGDGGTATGPTAFPRLQGGRDRHRHVDGQRRIRRDQHRPGHDHGQRRAAGIHPGLVFTPPCRSRRPRPVTDSARRSRRSHGNVAIAARFDNGPSSTSHPGAVYLYDGVPTDDGISTTYVYGALIHVFADPNPAPGDQFGASIAVVGNVLIVGAPGSSHFGPGDGAVYLFDANSESSTFGALLATLTIPNPGARIKPHSARRSARRERTSLIGAPGKNGGAGEVDVYEGDPTSPGSAACLLSVPNPSSRAGIAVRRGRGGAGNQPDRRGTVRRHARAVSPGKVYLFDGTTGALLTTIANPDGIERIWLGGRLGRREHPDRLAAGRHRQPSAGAAFLFGPTGTLLKTFVQPDGGGGHFGAAVAGTGNQALIGAPGASLGTTDAGRRLPLRRRSQQPDLRPAQSPPCKSPRPPPATRSARRSGSTTERS